MVIRKRRHTFDIVTKSGPRKTPFTPSILNSCFASKDLAAETGVGKSRVPFSRTGTPGINFRLLGLGVS